MVVDEMVSFEVAKLLKKLGFDVPCRRYYDTVTDDPDMEYVMAIWGNGVCVQNSKLLPTEYARCTQQMAMRWIREIHCWFIQIYYVGVTNKYEYSIYKTDNSIPHQPSMEVIPCDTYEDAVESAIKYCLENFIK